jgi:hypothetical protein
MWMDVFRIAYAQARAKIGIDTWVHLASAEQERAVAEEYRKLTERPAANDSSADPRVPI